MERILITGANGHLGLRLVARLACAGEPGRGACAIVRSESAAAVVRGLPGTPECRVVEYRDVDALARVAEGCTAVVHLVGILKETARTRYGDAHEATAEVLARAAEKAGLRRIVYPSILGASAASANACLASKGRAEAILLRCGVPATVLRLPMVLGPGDPAAVALRGQASKRVLALVRGGATREQPIDAEDVTAAVLAAAARAGAPSEALDLAGPEALTHRALVLRVARLLGRPAPRIVPLPLAFARAFAFAAERLLANPPVTRAMLEVLEHDDDVDPLPACRALGITLTPLDVTLRRAVVGRAAA